MATCIHYEECRKAHVLVVDLAKEIDVKNGKLFELEHKLEEKDRQYEAFKQEEEKLKYNMESVLKTIEHKVQNLEEILDEFVLEQSKLLAENEKLKKDLEFQKKSCGNLGKAMEEKGYNLMMQTDLMIKKENMICERECHTNKRLKMLQEQKDKVRCGFNNDNYVPLKELERLKEELEYLECLNNTLIVKERMSNQELQDARKEAIMGIKELLNLQSIIGIKHMGEVNRKAFQDACKQKFPSEDWEEKAEKSWSHWKRCVRDVHWQPFKTITIDGKLQEIIDEGDEKLNGLKNKWGEEAYKAIADALLELNEYNPSGRYPVPELWNLKMERRATMSEIIGYAIKQWKTLECGKTIRETGASA